ncbi:MAG: zinc metallopeptidase [Bacillota bacterium]|nr:zinc metallopeptidase [Bacillota bacterium]
MGMFYYLFDNTYFIYIVPAIIVTLLAQVWVKSAFSKYSQISNSRRITGAMAAERVLAYHGVTGVKIVPIEGNLSDNYDPESNTIRLSSNVYNGISIASVSIAAHEAGHAVQHAENYAPNRIRTALVPVVNFSSHLSWVFIIVGMFMASFPVIIDIGIVLYSLAVLFTIVTLPVEFNASARALKTIRQTDLLSDQESAGAKTMLTAAAMTYVAATFAAIMTLLRLLALTNRRN